jgi:hypothetical protein
MNPRLSLLIFFLGVYQLPADAVSQGPEFVQSLTRSELTPSQDRVLDQISRLKTIEGDVQIVRINPAPLRERSHFALPLPGRSPVTVEANQGRRVTGFKTVVWISPGRQP